MKFRMFTSTILLILICMSSGLHGQDTLLVQNPQIFFNTAYSYALDENSQVIDTKRNYTLPITVTAGVNLAGSIPFYNHVVNAWGRPDGKFHFKDDWSGDNLALNDEVSHLFVSYKLMQFFNSGYNLLGFSPKTARILGMVETAFILTAVEFPIDAYNPDQGFGVSDLIFNYTGIFMAYIKITNPAFENWDLKASVKSLSQSNKQVIGSNNEDFDNYIYWITYRKSSLVFGLGYSTDHPQPMNVDKQFFVGIGTTVPDLIRPISKKLANALDWMGTYYLNLNWNFATID